MAKQTKGFRLQFKFWLDAEKADELELAETIEELKSERSFARTVRDGIRLIVALREKDVSVLHELFPWTADTVDTPKKPSDSGQGGSELKALRNEIANLRQSMLQAPTQPIIDITGDRPVAKSLNPADSNLDALLGGLDVKTASSSEDNKSNWNFAISSALAVFGNADSLPLEVIEYGLRTKRLQPHHVNNSKPSPRQKKQDKPTGNAKQIAGSDVAFMPPSIDDDYLDSFQISTG